MPEVGDTGTHRFAGKVRAVRLRHKHKDSLLGVFEWVDAKGAKQTMTTAVQLVVWDSPASKEEV